MLTFDVLLLLKCCLIGFLFGIPLRLLQIFKFKIGLVVFCVIEFILTIFAIFAHFLLLLTKNYGEFAVFSLIGTFIGILIAFWLVNFLWALFKPAFNRIKNKIRSKKQPQKTNE